MKIRDIIVEQEKPGLLRRAAGALGRGAYALTTGEFYPDDDLTPIEQIAKSATKNRSAVIKDAILQIQKRKIDTPEKFTQFYQSYFGGENPKLQVSIQKKLQDLGAINPNDTATVEQAIAALTDERIKTLNYLAKGEFVPTQQPGQSAQPAQAPVQQPVQTTTSTTVPPAKSGYINTLDVAGNKYWLDARGDWYVYTGNMWPNDILASQKVSDADVDKLAPYIQAGKVTQEPYGTKKKK